MEVDHTPQMILPKEDVVKACCVVELALEISVAWPNGNCYGTEEVEIQCRLGCLRCRGWRWCFVVVVGVVGGSVGVVVVVLLWWWWWCQKTRLKQALNLLC